MNHKAKSSKPSKPIRRVIRLPEAQPEPMIRFTGTCPQSLWPILAAQVVAHGATIEQMRLTLEAELVP